MVGAQKMDTSMKVDSQALTRLGLCLEKGLAWSLAVWGRLSLAWHAGGQGWHVPACRGPAACLLSSITKQQMGLGGGVSQAISSPGHKASP